jgi:hypothetical protein
MQGVWTHRVWAVAPGRKDEFGEPMGELIERFEIFTLDEVYPGV